MTTPDTEALRRVAEAAVKSYRDDAPDKAAAIDFDVTFDPPTVLALLDERDTAQRENERLKAERDEARAVVIDCNNSLFGSQGYFVSEQAAAIEGLKERAGRKWRDVQAMNFILAVMAACAEGSRKEADGRSVDESRWIWRFSQIREASGVGHKPMLSEVPDAIRAKIDAAANRISELEARVGVLEGALTKIADGKVPPDMHGHYLAHREAVKIARAALTPQEKDQGR